MARFWPERTGRSSLEIDRDDVVRESDAVPGYGHMLRILLIPIERGAIAKPDDGPCIVRPRGTDNIRADPKFH